MSPEITPEILRQIAATWVGGETDDDYGRHYLRQLADSLERHVRPLPTKPGWYPDIVVEYQGESCVGALLSGEVWVTGPTLAGWSAHSPKSSDVYVHWDEETIAADKAEAEAQKRFAETGRYGDGWTQDLRDPPWNLPPKDQEWPTGDTPGNTLWRNQHDGGPAWGDLPVHERQSYESDAQAILTAHSVYPGLNSLAESFRMGYLQAQGENLAPIVGSPKPGEKGLLPVTFDSGTRWSYAPGKRTYFGSNPAYLHADSAEVLLDPRQEEK